MGISSLFLLAVGLSMDAFAVAICKGLSMKRATVGNCMIVGGYFGFFQALMPVIGYFLGVSFRKYITSFDHWIAFVLLLFIGGKMIWDTMKGDEQKSEEGLGPRVMIPYAIATSIDALAVGITLAFLNVSIVYAALFIGIITFLLSFLGVKIGNLFGAKYEKKATLVGGIILIGIGTKILLEHLEIL